jgi:hypothetical protein
MKKYFVYLFFIFFGVAAPYSILATSADSEELWDKHRILTSPGLNYGTNASASIGRVWVTPDITEGKYPVVVHLHGANRAQSPLVGPNSNFALDKNINKALSGGKLTPFIFVAPYHADHLDPDKIWQTNEFSIDDVLDKADRLIHQKLPKVSTDRGRIVVSGHSNAASRANGGVHKIFTETSGLLGAVAIDGGSGANHANAFGRSNAKYKMDIVARNLNTEGIRKSWMDVVAGDYSPFTPCLETFFKECFKGNNSNVYFYRANGNDGNAHNEAVRMFFERLLQIILPGDGTVPLSGSSSKPITADEIASLLRQPTPQIGISGLDFTEVGKKYITRETDGVYLYLPFIGEYIAAVYRYGVGIVSTLAVVMIMLGGVLWITSRGSNDKVKLAKDRITKAIIGLALAIGSYTVLYTLNPNLVTFSSLKILYIPETEFEVIYENDSIPLDNNYPTYSGKVSKPTWTAKTFDCLGAKTLEQFKEKKDAIIAKQPEAGVIPLKEVITYTCDGIVGKATTLPEMKGPLCKAGKLARQKGYEIKIASSYRNYEGQVRVWCTGKRNPKKTAVPGSSNHGHGRAVDVALLKDGKPITTISSATQCGVPLENVKTLANIFFEADPGFHRLETEIWHFEYGTKGQGIRIREARYPLECG